MSDLAENKDTNTIGPFGRANTPWRACSRAHERWRLDSGSLAGCAPIQWGAEAALLAACVSLDAADCMEIDLGKDVPKGNDVIEYTVSVGAHA
jgi:hypothetical protein